MGSEPTVLIVTQPFDVTADYVVDELHGLGRSSGWRSCSKTPGSRCPRWPPRTAGCRVGRWARR
jgi:hypothetical protein